MMARAVALTLSLALPAGAAWAQKEQNPAPAADGRSAEVVPYCIEPMESMPPKILELIDAQFRCAAGTHLQRDSRPARVVPTGEKSDRPFVVRFGPPETANAWFVRGFTPGQ